VSLVLAAGGRERDTTYDCRHGDKDVDGKSGEPAHAPHDGVTWNESRQRWQVRLTFGTRKYVGSASCHDAAVPRPAV
jgi:hypothetical protein